MTIPTELTTFIEERISRFDEECTESLRWLGRFVERHGALPLYVGWTETLGIRPDGSVVCWSTEDDTPAETVEDPLDVNLALSQGAARYPKLQALVPKRPRAAQTCDVCGGRGKLRDLPDAIICKCAGLGWLPNAGAG